MKMNCTDRYVTSRAVDAVGVFFFSSRRRHTRLQGDWSSDVCSSDLQDVRVVGLDHEVDRAAGVGATDAQRVDLEGGQEDDGRGAAAVVLADAAGDLEDRKRGGEGKKGDIGGRRII